MNLLYWILIIVGGSIGAASTLYLTFSLPVVLIWKIYRKVKYHMSIYD